MELLFFNVKPMLYQKRGSAPTPLRSVASYEIEYQLCDEGISHIDGNVYHARKGQMLFVKPGVKRYTEGAYSCLAVHFSCYDRKLAGELDRLPHTLMPLNPQRAEELLRNIYNLHINVEKRSLQQEGLLLQILAEYIDSSQMIDHASGEYSAYADGIYRTVEYMQKNYAEHITSELLAKQMFISTNFYQKIFKGIMGMSPAQYLRDIRISEASRLLANTDFSLQEIAEKCGFNCASYFVYVIKKYLGVTPAEYRRANQTLL